MERLVCLLVGYCFGLFLTAELVARFRTGRGAAELGSGNPGMANIAGSLGAAWGALVLLGDVGKTAAACLLARFVLFPELGALATLYAGLGTALGHNFPLWRRFRGGKGVAVTCTFLVLAQPLWGIASDLLGLLVVVLTGYLPLGAAVIPVAFIPAAFITLGPEAGALAGAAALLMLFRHRRGLLRVFRRQEPRRGRCGQRKI
ncbi:MAG TPA: glycerol-3-phosphate acyltransferase [Candidatus Galloscillospira excrementavium]|nr:glycerol-3-phosphate acyltransferase [Candidatus Galloscillospira excrementavium]